MLLSCFLHFLISERRSHFKGKVKILQYYNEHEIEFHVFLSKTKACNISLYFGETFLLYHILNFWFPWNTHFWPECNK